MLLTAPGVHLDLLRQDTRYAWRTLTARAQRSFAVAAILTLALGVGAATAIFSVVHAVMLAPLPFRAADRLVRLYETNKELNITEFSASVPNLDVVAAAGQALSLEAIKGAEANLTDGGSPEHMVALAVTAGFLPTLGLAPVAGRDFRVEDDRPGGVRVAMVERRPWQRRYGRDPGLIGRSIALDGVAHTVIGVVPQDVGFSTETDLWVPMAADLANESRDNKLIEVVGRLADGASLAQAQAELEPVTAALEAEFPKPNRGWGARLDSDLRLDRRRRTAAAPAAAAGRRRVAAGRRLRQRREPAAGPRRRPDRRRSACAWRLVQAARACCARR